jgi:hypothetical protein
MQRIVDLGGGHLKFLPASIFLIRAALGVPVFGNTPPRFDLNSYANREYATMGLGEENPMTATDPTTLALNFQLIAIHVNIIWD